MAGNSTITWRQNLTINSDISPFDSPLPMTHKAFADCHKNHSLSWKRYNIAGILVTIYGLSELPSHNVQAACLWLLHGRGDTQDSMSFCATALWHAWDKRRREGQRSLICVTFDQRNHGSRLVDDGANQSWKAGNRTHGQDMFTHFHGTSRDLSLLIDHLPGYIPTTPVTHIMCGVSLGGHATWHGIMQDARIAAGIIVLGCPDYAHLMTDRAVRSKLASCNSDPPARNFLGSPDFPKALMEAVEKYDPAGLLLGGLDTRTGDDHVHEPSEREKSRLRPMMREKLGGKKLLLLSGGADRLVPYKLGEAFLTWLKKALDPDTGWFNDGGTELEDVLDAQAGHEFSAAMRLEAERWLCDLLAGKKRSVSPRRSKM